MTDPVSPTTEKILTAIESRQVTPRPKWYFVLKNSILWLPGLITTMLGGYTISGIIYGIVHNPYVPLLPHIHHPIILAIAIPMLWVLSFLLFCAITLSLLRRTHRAYRHNAVRLLSASIIASVIIGIILYAFTRNSLDNQVNTYYRYPTEHQRNFFERILF